MPVLAAGPLINETDVDGSTYVMAPPVWDNSSDVVYHPEAGACGPFSNEEMIDKLETVLSVWTDISTVDLVLTAETGEVPSVDVDNFNDYLYLSDSASEDVVSDGISPVAFDDDGEIISSLVGEGNEVFYLGLASVVTYSGGVIEEGQALLNCKCLEDHPTETCTYGETEVTFTEDDLDFTIAHEMGHYLNMGHTNVNADIYYDDDYSEGDMPIMFPISSNMTTIVAHADDEASLSMLYPSGGDVTESYCKVTGTVVDADSVEVPCLDIWAVTDSDTTLTISTTTGSVNEFNTDTSASIDYENCEDRCGYFEMYVKPSTAYTITAYDVNPDFVGGSSVGPCVDAQPEYGIAAEALATIAETDCTDGTETVIELGTLPLSESTGLDPGDGSGDSGDDGGGGGGKKSSGGNNLNPYGYYSCSLNLAHNNCITSSFYVLTSVLMGLLLFRLLQVFFQRKHKRIRVMVRQKTNKA